MTYRVLADLVLLLHLAFVAFVVLGGFLALRWRRVAWVQLPAALWGAFVELSGGVCPLTPLENSLRRAAGESGYPGGFVEHYLLPVVYPKGLTPTVQLILGCGVVVVNALVYYSIWRRRRRCAT